MSPEQLKGKIEKYALDLGFSRIGFTDALVSEKDKKFYEWWTSQGYGAGMHYLREQKKRRESLENILPGVKSVIVCLLRYPATPEQTRDPQKMYGKVARYAMAEDYHSRLKPLLETLAAELDQLTGQGKSLAYVDTGAIPERSLAQKAGLGWVGKNSMLIHPEEGSWFWLGEILTRYDFGFSSVPITDHCGKCRACLDACPTGAILEDLRALDARKCLAYWNIEHRGPIPQELHAPMQEWILGCDICQEVCPWNKHAEKKSRAELGQPAPEYIALEDILTMSEGEYRKQYKHRALSRAKFEGLKRNASIVKKNLVTRSNS